MYDVLLDRDSRTKPVDSMGRWVFDYCQRSEQERFQVRYTEQDWRASIPSKPVAQQSAQYIEENKLRKEGGRLFVVGGPVK
jgi:hypothetical protein